MAISQTTCTSFKVELLKAEHNFSSHTFKLALYTSSASLGADTTAYSTSNEITNTSGSAYSAGGKNLTVTSTFPKSSGTTALVDFGNVSWDSASFTARGALIYNSSASNKAVAVLDFGSDRVANNDTFEVQFPVSSATTAVIRIS
jgi:hypothetical protein|tara:strand:+ start:179 stop:613 length:435 start_codon:yes stop_codon:yes gene_type:complete